MATLYGGEWARLLLSATRYDIDRSGRSVQRTFAAQDPTNPRYAPFFSGPSTADRANPFGAFAQLALTSQRLGTLTIDAGLQRLDSMAEFQPVSALTHQSRESIQNLWSSATHEKSWTDRFNTRLTLGAAMGAPTRDDQLYLTQNFTQVYTPNYGYKSGTASFVANYTSGTLISARFGADAELQRQRILYYTSTFHDTQGTRMPGDRVDLIAPGVPRDETLSDLGLHGQLTVSPLEARPNLLQISLNGRVDRVDYGTFNPGLQPSWRVAVVDRWTPSIVTKLIYGRAFQAPSGVLMFAQPAFPTNNVIGSLTSGATSPLKPQTVDSVEGVAYVLLGDRLSIDLAGFYQRIADRIEFQFAGSDYIAHNAGAVSYVGAEASLKAVHRFHHSLCGRLLRAFADQRAIRWRSPDRLPRPDGFGRVRRRAAAPAGAPQRARAAGGPPRCNLRQHPVQRPAGAILGAGICVRGCHPLERGLPSARAPDPHALFRDRPQPSRPPVLGARVRRVRCPDSGPNLMFGVQQQL